MPDKKPILLEEENQYRPKFTNEIVKLWKGKNGKLIILGMISIVFILISFIVGFVLYLAGNPKAFIEGVNYLSCLAYGLFTPVGFIVSFCITVLICGFCYALCFKNGDLNRVDFIDERGVEYDNRGLYGTAHPMKKKEAYDVFEIGSIENVKGPILAQFSTEGKETICLAPETDRNRNILVLGSPGTGKSFCYVRGAVFQAVRRGESVVVTDPKGEIYSDMAGFLRNQGYEVRVFDLVDLQSSDAWDCMQEIYNPVTGDLDQLRLNEFSSTIFTNTCEGKDDPFWGTGEKNLFNAAIAFCAYRYEKSLKRLYKLSAKKLMKDDKRGKVIPLTYQEQLLLQMEETCDTTMNDRRKILNFIIESYFGKEKVASMMSDIEHGVIAEEKAPAQCDIAAVYHMIVGKTLDDLSAEIEAERIPIHHVASIAWNIFKNGSDNVKPGFVTGLAQRLYLFQMRDLRRITSKQDKDNIVLERLGERKCAYFCIISDKSSAMRAISSLFFNFLFRDVSDAADRYGPENRIYVNVICDEFANLGAIPDFQVVIATVRSRKINISIICQSTSQLTQTYLDPNKANTIMACCDTVLFLGCNDEETSNYISNLSGVASIRAASTKDDRPSTLGFRPMGQGYSISDGSGKRNVYNPDEVLRLARDEVLIYHNGCNMLKAKRCGFIEHPFFKQGMPAKEYLSLREHASSRFKNNEALDAFTQADVEKARRTADEEMAKKKSSFTPADSAGEKRPFRKSSGKGKYQSRGDKNVGTGGKNLTSD